MTDATPLKDRWGGWYVSGSADDPHLGNRWIDETPLDEVDFPAEVSSFENLGSLIDTEKYLQPTSDVVACCWGVLRGGGCRSRPPIAGSL